MRSFIPKPETNCRKFCNFDRPNALQKNNTMTFRIFLFALVLFLFQGICFSQVRDTLVDSRDGQSYAIVKIGKQWWMAENLNFDASGSFCYEREAHHCNTHGRLYTYESAKHACPTGWHVPSHDEWTDLSDYLGGEEVAGIKLIKTATKAAAAASMNSSGFSALPSGYRNVKGVFTRMDSYAIWWTSTEYNASMAWTRYLLWNNNYFYSHYDRKTCAASIRCVMDK
jgi:uncharacterized protein (TIGR02145 family)